MQGIWEILYVDDLVIMAKTEEDLQRRIFEWLNSMERGGLKVNVDKTEIMVSAKRRREEIIEVEDAHHNSLKQVERFKYLRGIITKEGGTGTKEGGTWAKWNEVSCVVLVG